MATRSSPQARSGREFYQKAAERNREMAKLNREQRREAAKEWQAEKKRRERDRYYDDAY